MLKNHDKVINSFILLIFFGMFLISCQEGGKDGTLTRISGSFPQFKGKKVTLSEIDSDRAIPIDTTEISSSGNFKFRFKRQGPGYFLVKIDNKNYVTLVIDKETRIKVASQNDQLRKGYSVEGSADSELYAEFELFLETNRRKVDSLSVQYREFQKSTGFQSMKLTMDENYKSIFNSQRDYAKAFIENHCHSLASLLVINRRFGERKILEEEQDYKYFVMVDSCLSVAYPGNKHILSFQKKVVFLKQRQQLIDLENKKLAAGNEAPDISLTNPSGKQVSLHSLKGNKVIVYFWASVDPESRQSNLLLKEILKQQSSGKVKVYAIGLESYPEMWAGAINKDGIAEWTHVTDFLGQHSSATSLYGFPDTYPYLLLLDKNMTILYRGGDLVKLTSLLATLP